MRHHGFQELVRTGSRRVLFYFYWGIGSATAVSFLEPSVGRRALVRFHGFDLYAERGSGHVPFQKDLVRRLAMGTPCSEYGLDYLRELYPDAAATGRLRCMRLGTRSIGLSRGSDDGMLRIVSIAFMHPVKRVTLLAQAITKVTCPVRWEHIGDGPDWQAVNELVQSVPANVEVILHGKLSPKEAHAHLVKKSFDLFINTSESEGVPVSIMEALSAGIPVIATAVGGTPEIVDQQVGRLIPKDITPITLAKTIDDFAALPQHSRDDLRRNAYKRFAERCDQEVVGRQLIESLLQIEATFYDDSNADDMGRE